MKHRIFFIGLLLVPLTSAQGQYVPIQDVNFRQKLIGLGYGSCFDAAQTMLDTTCSLVTSTSVLDVSEASISNLEGVQYFKSLDSLSCYGNQLSALPVLPGLLRILDCRDNQLTEIASLPNSLQILSCSYNQIESIGTLPSGLIELNCFSNRLTCLPYLPNTLSILYCGDNGITALPALPHSLRSVDCSGNQLAFLPALPDSLTLLYCGGNRITALPTLPNSLTSLECLDNYLTSLPDLPDSLYWINLSNNPALHCLPHLNKIARLNFINTTIDCLPNYPQNNLSSVPDVNTVPLCQPYNTSECTDYPLPLLSVYPIPTFSNVTFSLIDHTVAISRIKIMDMIGNSIFDSEQINNLMYIFQISNYSAGVYFYEVTIDSGQTFRGKVEYLR